MYRYILLLMMSIVVTGCTGIAKIKERYHRAPFEQVIDRGDYQINLYEIKYPEKYEEKIEFYNDFSILLKKLLVYDSTLNILYPEELKKDILKLGDNLLLPEEEMYVKPSSELSKIEMEEIDKNIDFKLDNELGKSQYYLNKQVYFWKKLLKQKNNTRENYTELDKERLIQEVKKSRKEMFEILNEVEITSILKITDPYRSNEDNYWQQKDVYIHRKTKINPQIFREINYIYLGDIEDLDAKKIVGEQLKFDSKIVIIENKLYNGYTVVDNKFVFFHGGKNNISYYDGYKINLEIKEVTLKDLLKIDDDILIDDFLNPNLYKKRQGK